MDDNTIGGILFIIIMFIYIFYKIYKFIFCKKVVNQDKSKNKLNEKQIFYCKYCGQEFNSISDLVNSINRCNGPANNTTEHVLYEGNTNPPFYCKNCGKQFQRLRDLCYAPSSNCQSGKKHEVYERH